MVLVVNILALKENAYMLYIHLCRECLYFWGLWSLHMKILVQINKYIHTKNQYHELTQMISAIRNTPKMWRLHSKYGSNMTWFLVSVVYESSFFLQYILKLVGTYPEIPLSLICK